MHDVGLGRREMDRYLAYQERNLDRMRGSTGEET